MDRRPITADAEMAARQDQAGPISAGRRQDATRRLVGQRRAGTQRRARSMPERRPEHAPSGPAYAYERRPESCPKCDQINARPGTAVDRPPGGRAAYPAKVLVMVRGPDVEPGLRVFSLFFFSMPCIQTRYSSARLPEWHVGTAQKPLMSRPRNRRPHPLQFLELSGRTTFRADDPAAVVEMPPSAQPTRP